VYCLLPESAQPYFKFLYERNISWANAPDHAEVVCQVVAIMKQEKQAFFRLQKMMSSAKEGCKILNLYITPVHSCSRRDLNPSFGLERAASLTGLDDGSPIKLFSLQF